MTNHKEEIEYLMLFRNIHEEFLDNKIKIEVNIFDFNQDIYGETLKIEFVKWIRNEEKFANLDELKQALAYDKIACSHV